jgi:hypothetical protein
MAHLLSDRNPNLLHSHHDLIQESPNAEEMNHRLGHVATGVADRFHSTCRAFPD